MCTGAEAALLTTAVAGAGTYLQQESANDAADRQQKIVNQAAEADARLSKEKGNLITDFTAKTYDPTARADRYEQSADTNTEKLLAGLKDSTGNEGGAEVPKYAEGNLSSDYAAAREKASENSIADIMKRAMLMGRANANGNLYQGESELMGNLNTDLAGIAGKQAVNRGYYNTQLNGVRNTGSLAGGLLTGAAPGIGNYAMNR